MKPYTTTATNIIIMTPPTMTRTCTVRILAASIFGSS
jgi:hypothetical protein